VCLGAVTAQGAVPLPRHGQGEDMAVAVLLVQDSEQPASLELAHL
jgi:hypothetical protein